MQNLPGSPDTGVILVASGYLFRCPECDAVGYRTSALERRVLCDHCHAEFPVVEVRHRTNDFDITPGVDPGAVYIPQEEPNSPEESRLDQPRRQRKGRDKKKGNR
jgi:hypothetical protein